MCQFSNLNKALARKFLPTCILNLFREHFISRTHILYWVHCNLNRLCVYACTECLLYAVLFILWSKWSIWWGSDSMLQCSTCRKIIKCKIRLASLPLSRCACWQRQPICAYIARASDNWQLVSYDVGRILDCLCAMCVCVCVSVYSITNRGPQPEYTPSTEDRTDVRASDVSDVKFFLCLKSPPKRGRGCKIGFRGMSSDDGLRRVWTCFFFFYTP